MPLNEEAVLFGANRSLVGIVTHPADFDPARPAVLLLNAGLMHRAGPYRLYVKLARQLASLGFLVLRFDFSGIGDSLRRLDSIPENRANPLETIEAMEYLEAAWGTRQFISIGNCRGAWVSFMTACQDQRLIGLALINPDTLADDRRSAISTQLKTRSFVQTSLARGSSWVHVLLRPHRYRSQFRVLSAHLRSPLQRHARAREADQVAERLRSVAARGVNVLFLMSEQDPSRDYLAAIERRFGPLSERFDLEVVPEGGHNFMSLAAQRSLIEAVGSWVQRITGRGLAARKVGDTADS